MTTAKEGFEDRLLPLLVEDLKERQIPAMPPTPPPARRRLRHVLLVAALALGLVAGGIAVAGTFDDGFGVNDPAIEKIPFVQDRIASVEEEIKTLDTSTAEGSALAAVLKGQLQALEERLSDLCEEAGQPEACAN
jgi:hypothetical protein